MALTGAAPATAAPSIAPVATVPVMVVLDASGSMNESDAPGPRIDAAKKAVKSLVAAMPSGSRVGLTVYGANTGSGAADKAKGCQDIRTLMPVAKLDAAGISSAVDRVTASGYTPIGNALRTAAKALPQEGPRSIVLVSDGEDTCAPPAPCDVAKELKKQGVDLTVHTVGFKVDAKAREQLSCVATSTGGTYSDAADATTLTAALETKVDQAITGYNVKGTKVTGADQLSEQAPLLQPGQYVDTYAKGGPDTNQAGTTKYYTVPIQKNSTLYVSATLVNPVNQSAERSTTAGVKLTVRARDNYSCAQASAVSYYTAERHEPAIAVMTKLLGGFSYSDRCPSSGVGILEVIRTGSAFGQQPLPMEIVVRYEPPADATGVPPGFNTDQPVLAKPTFGAKRSITPGSSFNDAPALASGVTYETSFTTGEDHYYRIPLKWGQRFTYLIEQDRTSRTNTDVQYVRTDFFNPIRETVRTTGSNSTELWFSNRDTEPFTGSSNVPARYSNRESYGAGAKDYKFDGSYYLRLSADNAAKPLTTRYRIMAVVSGTPEAGPRYLAGATTIPTPPATSTPAGTTPSGKDAAQTSGGAAGAQSPPSSVGDTITASADTGDASGVGGVTVILLVVAALAGAGLAVVATSAWSRRRSAQGPQT